MGFKKANNISNEVDGLETQEESFTDDIKISRVKVLNDNGEQAIGKRKGQLQCTALPISIRSLPQMVTKPFICFSCRMAEADNHLIQQKET